MCQWLIVHTVVTATTAVVAAAACRWLRLGPVVRHLLWLIVLVKFLTPPIVYWPWTLPMYGPAPLTAGPPAAPVRFVVIDEDPVEDAGPSAPGAAAPPPAAPPPADPPAEAPPAAPALSWDWLPTAAVWAWLAGGGVVALRNALRIQRWRRRLMRGLPAPESLVKLVGALAASVGVRPPRVVVLPGAASPMVWGFGAPRLIWPLGLDDRLSAVGRRAVLLHELSHIRRRDHWVGWLLLLGGCVWWWHPLFWWVRRRLTHEAELACDAQVIGAAPDGRRAYAEALLEVSQRLVSTAALPALGAAAGRRDLERRLVMIMRGPAARRLSWAGLAGVGLLGLLALPAWTLGQDARTPPAVPSAGSAQPTPPAGVPMEGAFLGGGAPAAPGAGPMEPAAADADRDAKIRELEKKVEQLLREIHELRKGGPQPKPDMQPGGPGAAAPPADFVAAQRQFGAWVEMAPGAPAGAGEAPGEVITLTRVSYKLKPATAEALAAFLKDNVKASILETKVDGENLVITTTPDAQRAIGQFIALIQGKTPGRPGMMGPGGFPPGGMGGLNPGGAGIGQTGGGFVPGPGGTGGPFGPGPGGTGPTPPSGGTSGPPPGAVAPPGKIYSGPDPLGK